MVGTATAVLQKPRVAQVEKIQVEGRINEVEVPHVVTQELDVHELRD